MTRTSMSLLLASIESGSMPPESEILLLDAEDVENFTSSPQRMLAISTCYQLLLKTKVRSATFWFMKVMVR